MGNAETSSIVPSIKRVGDACHRTLRCTLASATPHTPHAGLPEDDVGWTDCLADLIQFLAQAPSPQTLQPMSPSGSLTQGCGCADGLDLLRSKTWNRTALFPPIDPLRAWLLKRQMTDGLDQTSWNAVIGVPLGANFSQFASAVPVWD